MFLETSTQEDYYSIHLPNHLPWHLSYLQTLKIQEASHSYTHYMGYKCCHGPISSLLCTSLLTWSAFHHNELAVGLANTGVKRKALESFITVSYSTVVKLQPGLDTECDICLSEFLAGEQVKLLPKCHHGFHVRCIDGWLSSHSSCPTCRHCLIQTCQKIVGSSTPNQPPHDKKGYT